LAELEVKLKAYRVDPDAFDNRGLLRDAPSPEIREISGFRKLVDEITGGG
jgi:hypothetical protein